MPQQLKFVGKRFAIFRLPPYDRRLFLVIFGTKYTEDKQLGTFFSGCTACVFLNFSRAVTCFMDLAYTFFC